MDLSPLGHGDWRGSDCLGHWLGHRFYFTLSQNEYNYDLCFTVYVANFIYFWQLCLIFNSSKHFSPLGSWRRLLPTSPQRLAAVGCRTHGSFRRGLLMSDPPSSPSSIPGPEVTSQRLRNLKGTRYEGVSLLDLLTPLKLEIIIIITITGIGLSLTRGFYVLIITSLAFKNVNISFVKCSI